ncbi:MAG TPA: CHAP domain-containing protein [Ignavibacteria bacterium]
MKIKNTLVLITFLFLFSSINKSFADPFNTLLGTYNGIDVYSNGTVGNQSNLYNYENGTNTGMKWQCVEYVNRYYLLIYNKNIRVPGHNGNEYFPNATQHGLTAYLNNGTTSPAIGDILCFSGGNYGHVAIVREVGSTYIRVAQQNVLNNSGDVNYQMNMQISNGHYDVTWGGYTCQGWLHNPGTPAPTATFTVNGYSLSNWKFWKIPPMPSNFYNVNMIVTGLQSGQYWALYIAKPSGNIQTVATFQNLTNFTFYFNVDSASALYPNGGEYFFKFTAQGGTPVWSNSPQFYISNLPTMSVTITPQPLVIGQPAKLKWFLYGGIPGLPYGGLTGRIRFQWYQDNQPKQNLDSAYFTADSLIFIVPSSIPNCTIPGNNFKIGAANSDVGTSAPGGLVSVFTNVFSIVNPTGIKIKSSIIPGHNKLYDNYPNPFNPTTNIKFDVEKSSNVKIVVYDVMVREVQTLVNESLKPGTYEAVFYGSSLSSGVYFYKLIVEDFIEMKKMILLK